MKKIHLHEDIFYVENFLTKEEIFYLYSECVSDNWPAFDKIKLLKDEKGNKVMSEIKDRIHQLLPEKDRHLAITDSKNVKKCRVGDEDKGGKWAMNPHHDAVQNPWKYGIIIYINDNYEGGELVYTNLGIDFKPKSGTIVMHASNDDCVHAVKRVTSGTRYTTTFFAGDPEDKILKRALDLINMLENK